jgi:hypothetical protein
LSIAGLVLGIVGIIFFWFPVVGIIGGVVGAALSALGMKQAKDTGQPTGIPTAGLVLSIVALALSVVAMIVCGASTACQVCSLFW